MIAASRLGHLAVPAAGLAAMVATPLLERGGGGRRATTNLVVAGFAASTLCRLGVRGRGRAVGAAVTVTSIGWAVERLGTRTGVPFGRYVYTGRLRPAIGGVPAAVPLAWFAMAAPAREAAHAALGPRSTPTRRILLGATALTAWDLFLDPQMVGEGYWLWARSGRYRGIPWTNFAGWFATSLVAMGALELAAPPGPDPDAGLVAEYAVMGTMETLAFAAFFRDRVVAAIGGAAMLPVAAAAALRLIAPRPPGQVQQ